MATDSNIGTVNVSAAVAPFVAAEIADRGLADRVAQPARHELTADEADQVLEAATVCRTLIFDNQHSGLMEQHPVPDEYRRRRASLLFALDRLITNIGDTFSDAPQVNLHRGHSWHCPSCDARITMLVPTVGAPTCSNHLQGGRLMVADK